MTACHIYNIRSTESFVDVLARRFLTEYAARPEELAEVLFLLPTRRACQNLAEAFVRHRGLTPTILPRMEPIADIEADEVFLTAQSEILPQLPPAVNNTERLLILARLIMQKPVMPQTGRISLAQAYTLAQNLAALMDLSYNENLSFDRLQELVPADFAAHWQETLRLLAIITEYWPQILADRHEVDVVQRRQLLLQAEIARWQSRAPTQKIVIAGSTAPFPLLKELVRTVAALPQGEVYLYGLDRYLPEDDWQKINENHPQYELKELLDYLHLARCAVEDINPAPLTGREILVSECLRPAETSDRWRHLGEQNLFNETTDSGIHLLNCDDVRQEAAAIALIMRQTLNEPEKTAALVTMDRNLARRVVAELKKWDIIADDSAGQPLSLTPIGIYLRLIIAVLADNFSQVSMLALLKHPFTACGRAYSVCNKLVYHIELNWRQDNPLDAEMTALLDDFKARLQELAALYEQPRVDLRQFLTAHIRAAENLADTDVKSGDKIIWRQDAGQAAARFISDFCENCGVMESIATNDYAAFFQTLLNEQNVRVRYGMHPRIKILGPIEARLEQFDVTVIGAANEGMWPKLPEADMWMSRPMRQDFGLPLPERAIGVMAADFAHLLQAPQVYITRSERADGAPTNKSRWWLRLETVLAALYADNKEKIAAFYDYNFAAWAKFADRAPTLKPISAPAPCPPVAWRPRRLSVSNIEYLMRDPYIIFAKYILHLYPLGDLDKDLDPRDYGNIVHEIIAEFNNRYPHEWPADATEQLLQMGEAAFAKAQISPQVLAFWQPKFAQTVRWLDKTEKAYRPEIATVHNEITGQISLDAPAGEFTVTAKADRVDETKDGRINILDYKTGQARSIKEITSGMAPQLPLEGLIAAAGGFTGLRAKEVAMLSYWKLGDKTFFANCEQSQTAMRRTAENLHRLITSFDLPTTPYLAKPNPAEAPAYSDYDHLSRYLEWAVKDDDNGNAE